MVKNPAEIKLMHVTTVPLSLFFFRGQTGFMKEKGLDFSVVSSPGELLDQFAEREDVETHAVSMARQITPFADVAALWKLISVETRVRPTILHAHTPKGGLLGMISAWISRVPIRVYHIRGLPYMTATGMKKSILQWSERISCKLAHEVLCVSPSIRDVALSDGICSPDKIKVLLGGSGNGVDASGQFNPDSYSSDSRERLRREMGIDREALVIGYVGRIVRDKGIEELAAAWSQLQVRFSGAHLLLVGPIESQDPVSENTLSSLRSDSRVHFVDYASDPAPFYSVMDIVALPTYREGFPNVPLEAAAMQLPVVATRIPGCVDAIADGITGLLVPPRDVDALKSALLWYLDDDELRTRHGEAGRARVIRDFQQEDIWEAIYQEYVSLLGARGWHLQVAHDDNSLRVHT